LNAKDGTRYEDAIVRDFLPYVDRSYRTTAKPSERAIQGISMGGFGALVIAFKHPELLRPSPRTAAIFEELPSRRLRQRPARVVQVRDRGEDIRESAGRFVLQSQQSARFGSVSRRKDQRLKVYFDVGEQDRYGFATGNRSFDEALTKAGVPHEFHLTDGDHGWAYLVSRSDPAFAFVSKALGAK
jgi:S-formylglutathione hydrolase FrmB